MKKIHTRLIWTDRENVKVTNFAIWELYFLLSQHHNYAINGCNYFIVFFHGKIEFFSYVTAFKDQFGRKNTIFIVTCLIDIKNWGNNNSIQQKNYKFYFKKCKMVFYCCLWSINCCILIRFPYSGNHCKTFWIVNNFQQFMEFYLKIVLFRVLWFMKPRV